LECILFFFWNVFWMKSHTQSSWVASQHVIKC
jgi:hypothetical protein